MTSDPVPSPLGEERVLGHPVHPVSREEAVRLVVDRARSGRPGAYICLTNVHTTVESQRLSPLRRATEEAFLSVPDGMPLVWILRRRGYRTTEKVTGVELVPMVASAGRDHGLRHAFYGGGPGIAEAVRDRLTRSTPGVEVVGAVSPPFGPLGEPELRDLETQVERLRPDILWVGLGAPKQDLFMARAARRLPVPVMIGVGAAFDFLAGAKPSAPRWMRHGGLEWLFRLATEPGRLWRRYTIGNSVFLYLLAREALGLPRNGRASEAER